MSGVKIKFYVLCCCVLISFEFVSGIPQHPLPMGEKASAENFVKMAEAELHEARKILRVIEWAYDSNITDYNEKRKLENKVGFCIFLTSLKSYYYAYRDCSLELEWIDAFKKGLQKLYLLNLSKRDNTISTTFLKKNCYNKV